MTVINNNNGCNDIIMIIIILAQDLNPNPALPRTHSVTVLNHVSVKNQNSDVSLNIPALMD